jgi:hypothetical protein
MSAGLGGLDESEFTEGLHRARDFQRRRPIRQETLRPLRPSVGASKFDGYLDIQLASNSIPTRNLLKVLLGQLNLTFLAGLE